MRSPVPENAEAWHTLPADEVTRRIHTEPERGLSGVEVARRLEPLVAQPDSRP